MNIAIIGYGKMGKEIEQIAVSRGHSIVLTVDEYNSDSYSNADFKTADVAIEFSTPQTVVNNIYECFDADIPVVVGTTGWMDKLEEVKKQCLEKKQSLFYASNFSIGVNLFFKLNEYLAKLMNPHPVYDVSVEEIHHIHKLDSPSGTALTLANQIIKESNVKQKWVNTPTENKNELSIISKRIGEVPGTHTVTYSSSVDEISITHFAHNRKGFALGAVLAAEFIIGKKGIFGMTDLLATTKF